MRIAEISMLPSGPAAPAAIRATIDALSVLSADVRADVRLLASQLATSPEVIGRARDGAVLALRVDRRPGVVHVELEAYRTASPRDQAIAVAAGPCLLARVCARWGMVHDGTTTTAWFEIDDPPPTAPSLCAVPQVPAVAVTG